MSDDGRENGQNGSAGGGSDDLGAEFRVLDGRLDEDTQISALTRAHVFPGFFPVVVIARHDAVFEALLTASVTEMQGDSPYRVQSRPSRHGRYVSYRLELHVADARAALERRSRLAALPGVVMLL